MIIRCYGAKGSIPVSGDDYRKYGGDTTCIEIRTENDEIIIIDAGSGIRRLGKKLLEEERYDFHLLFTHSHWDHILGFPFFKPIYDKRTRIHLTVCPLAQGDMKKLIARSMSPPYFPFLFDDLRSKITYSPECKESYQIDSITITPISLSHPNMGSGFKFVEYGKTFVFLTDNELGYTHRGGRTFEAYANFSKGADIIAMMPNIRRSNTRKPAPGVTQHIRMHLISRSMQKSGNSGCFIIIRIVPMMPRMPL